MMKTSRVEIIVALSVAVAVLFFSTALGVVGYMYLNLDSQPHTDSGAPLAAVLMLFNSYVCLSVCNFVGLVVLLCSKVPVSRSTKIVMHFGGIAQIIPVIYWIFRD
jgi:hypothetical protein